jgi:hypothetical protein
VFAFAAPAYALAAGLITIPGPPGSGEFGRQVKALPNGNIVIADPSYAPPESSFPVGAVYLYGRNGVLISKLTGGIDDFVGSGGIYILKDGNFVVCSPAWRNQNGAATFVNGVTGLSGQVSEMNSVVGTQEYDSICQAGIVPLSGSDYVVVSPSWSSNSTKNVGAITWCNGAVGCVGVVSQDNSLVGSTDDDQIGSGFSSFGVTALTNGNYVVVSPFWSNGGIQRVGAVTLCSGSGGCINEVSSSNSLIGSTEYDYVGSSNQFAASGTLTNGNYVVLSPSWHNGGIDSVGAATLINGRTGLIGSVTANNSLVGTSADDFDLSSVAALTNGNYVVSVPSWDNGVADLGAATFCDGTVGCTGAIDAGNSLVGSTESDRVGYFPAVPLSNGNYVISSPYWSSAGNSKVGAVTLCNGATGCTGEISAGNSLTGSITNDIVGNGGVTALTNGNYVVSSSYWSNGGIFAVGAATWCNGNVGCVGPIAMTNSLTGSSELDQVGSGSAQALTNGNYVVNTFYLNNGGAEYVGAITWGNGSQGSTGLVTSENSLIGAPTPSQDGFGNTPQSITSYQGGNYVVYWPSWQNGSLQAAGALTFLRGDGPQTGGISSDNGVFGNIAYEGQFLSFDYDNARGALIVGKPFENVAVIEILSDNIFSNGFDEFRRQNGVPQGVIINL